MPCASGARSCGFRARTSLHACTGFANPLSLVRADALAVEALVNQLARLRRDHHAIRLGNVLQPAGQIGRSPDRRHLPRGTFADRFVEDDDARCDAHADGRLGNVVRLGGGLLACRAPRSPTLPWPRVPVRAPAHAARPLALPKYASTPSPMWRSILPPYLSMISCQALKALLSRDLKRSAPIRSSISVEFTRSQKTTVSGRRSLSGAGMPSPPDVANIT